MDRHLEKFNRVRDALLQKLRDRGVSEDVYLRAEEKLAKIKFEMIERMQRDSTTITSIFNWGGYLLGATALGAVIWQICRLVSNG